MSAKRQRKKQLPWGYWKNPENQKRMLMAIEERLVLKPKERVGKIARDAGYSYTGISRKSLGKFRLDALGKAQDIQKAGTRGGFRVRRTAHERRALYKRILQMMIREPFVDYKTYAKRLGMTYKAFGQITYAMRDFGSMPPSFIETQRIKLIYKADTGSLTRKELASKLHINEVTVWHYRQRIKKIKEFAQKRKVPVEWVLNRYGRLVKAGLLK